jgi:gamma-glutamyltranspeptidase/glutathione hydrolase
MVVSGSEHATRAGAEILGSGGNAVDAAVATAFALAVTEPTQSGLGGRTQALVWNPDGTVFGVDATTTVPRSYDPDTAETVDDGYGVIGIPGTVAGLARVLEEGGSMSLPEVLAPAIRLAEGGFPLSEGEAGRLAAIRERLLLSAGARSVFLKPDSSAYASGEVLRQPFLADVLRTLSEEGPEAFYRGSIARRIAADMGAAGAYLTAADLCVRHVGSGRHVHSRVRGDYDRDASDPRSPRARYDVRRDAHGRDRSGVVDGVRGS